MACNCKVNQKLDYITKKYGTGGPRHYETHMSMDFVDFFENLGAFLLTVILSPFLFLYIIGKLIFSNDKSLHIEDILFFKNL
jgi:hypothetical protein